MVVQVEDFDLEYREVLTPNGKAPRAFKVLKRPRAWSIECGNGAAAISHSPEGAIGSAMCVLEEQDIARELMSKRERA